MKHRANIINTPSTFFRPCPRTPRPFLQAGKTNNRAKPSWASATHTRYRRLTACHTWFAYELKPNVKRYTLPVLSSDFRISYTLHEIAFKKMEEFSHSIFPGRIRCRFWLERLGQRRGGTVVCKR